MNLSTAVQNGQDNGLHWRIPIRLAAMAGPDRSEARRLARQFGPGRIARLDDRLPPDHEAVRRKGGPRPLADVLGPVVAGAVDLSSPERKLTGTALKVAGEIGRRLQMGQGLERKSGWLWVKVAYSTLAGWTGSAKSSVEVAVDRLCDMTPPVLIKRRQYLANDHGLPENDCNLYRVAWWARPLLGLPNPDISGQTTIGAVAEDTLEAPEPPPLRGLDLEAAAIAEAVEVHVAEAWERLNAGPLGKWHERAGVTFESYRAEQWEQYRKRPAAFLADVLERHARRQQGGGGNSRPPPGAS